jgi:hypothetical protein
MFIICALLSYESVYLIVYVLLAKGSDVIKTNYDGTGASIID